MDIVHAVIRKEGRVLLGRRSLEKKKGPGFWATIGGHVESGESVEAALIRECEEEAGVEVSIGKKIREFQDGDARHSWWLAEITSGDPRVNNDEHIDMKWIDKDNVEKIGPIFKEDGEIVSKLLREDSLN